MKNITCCFTGHRKLPKNRLSIIQGLVAEQLLCAYRDGYRRFVCGGALGFDTLCAIEVLRLRKRFEDISLILVYPCLGQDARWKEADREIYRKIYDECDECYCMRREYTPSCMHERNRAMVDESSLVIAYLENDRSGTAYTYNYAKENGVKTVNIASEIGENNGKHS